MPPVAPGLFSTTTAWPNAFAIFSDTAGAEVSLEPPGGYGTIQRIGRDGHACANAAVVSIASRSPWSTRMPLSFSEASSGPRCGERFHRVTFRHLGSREVELDRDAVRVLDEHLPESEDRHRTLEEAHVAAAAALEHRVASGGGESDVVERSGTALRGGLAVPHVRIERARVVLVESHEVHETVVAGPVLQVRRRRAPVQPVAREVERRPRPFVEPDHLGVEPS